MSCSQRFCLSVLLSSLVACQILLCPKIFAQSNIDANASLQLMQAEEDAFQAAANQVQNSVVQIETFGGQQLVEKETVADGPSSGTIVDPNGWIITSMFQFRNDPASITVVLPSGDRKAARVVARDNSRELTLLKIDVDSPLQPVIAAKRSEMQVGQWTIALGKTFDAQTASRSVGILSATRRIWDKAIQADVKVSPFNYGGPLINLAGETLGILAPIDPGIATEGEVQQWYDSGIGFAIPMEDILARLPLLKEGKNIERGLLGFRPAVKDDFAKVVEIAGVIPGTPMAKAGFKKGDLIKRVNNREILFVNQMRHVVGPLDAGTTVPIEVERDGERITRDCTLVDTLPIYRNPFVGLMLAEVVQSKSLVITAVQADGPADRAGLKVGDYVRQFAGEDVSALDDFATQIIFSDYRQPIDLGVQSESEGSVRVVQIQPTIWPSFDDLQAVSQQSSEKDGNKVESAARIAGTIELPFSDVPNKVTALVPQGLSEQPLGLFLVAAEPGEKLDQKQIESAWAKFCEDQQFILCVVSSGDPQAWSLEELEIFNRSLAHLRQQYTIDNHRTIIGGFNAGGTIALIAAFEDVEEYRGIFFGSDRAPSRFRLPPAEPQLAIDFLLAASNESIDLLQKIARERGYQADSIGAQCKLADDDSNEAAKRLRQFLATRSWL